MTWSDSREYERPRKGPESANQILGDLLTALGTSSEEERYRAYWGWVTADPVEDSLQLIPAIQARRAIGILHPDEALYLIGGVMEAIMECMRESDPRLRVYEESIDALEERLGREHEAAHGCTLEDGECYSDDESYFYTRDALEESDEYRELVRQSEAESLRLEAQLLRDQGEEEIARLREEDEPLFEERWQRGAKSLYPFGVGQRAPIVISKEDEEALLRDDDPDSVVALLRRLIAEQRGEGRLD